MGATSAGSNFCGSLRDPGAALCRRAWWPRDSRQHSTLCHTAGQLELAPRHYCSAGDARHASTQSRHLAVFKTAVTGSSFFASLLANHTATRVYFEPYGTAATFHCPSGSNEEHLLRTIFTESTCRFWPSFNSSRGGTCSCDFKCIHEPAVAKVEWQLTAVLLNPTLIARVDMLKMMRTLPDVPRIVILTRTNVLLHALGGLSDRETHKSNAWAIPIVFDGNRSARLRRVLDKLWADRETLTSIAYRVGGPHTYHVLYEDLQRASARVTADLMEWVGAPGVRQGAAVTRANYWKAGMKAKYRSPSTLCGVNGLVRDCAALAAAIDANGTHRPSPCVRRQLRESQDTHAGVAWTTSLRPSGEVAIDGECCPLTPYAGRRQLAELYGGCGQQAGKKPARSKRK